MKNNQTRAERVPFEITLVINVHVFIPMATRQLNPPMQSHAISSSNRRLRHVITYGRGWSVGTGQLITACSFISQLKQSLMWQRDWPIKWPGGWLTARQQTIYHWSLSNQQTINCCSAANRSLAYSYGVTFIISVCVHAFQLGFLECVCIHINDKPQLYLCLILFLSQAFIWGKERNKGEPRQTATFR